MSLLPWSKSETALGRLEESPSVDGFEEAKSAIEALARQQFLPGVKKRLEDYRSRFLGSRLKYFNTLIQSGDLESARKLNGGFPLEGQETADEELLKIAFLSRKIGQKAPTVDGIAFPSLKPDLRPIYFECRYHESLESADEPLTTQIVSAWLNHDPSAYKPRLDLFRRRLKAGEYDEAMKQAQSMPESHQANLTKIVTGDDEIALHHRAYFLLQAGSVDAGIQLLDRILEENPIDDWALSERARLADAGGQIAAARIFYARLHELNPRRPDISKRLGELAYAENDLPDAISRFGQAWESGDLESGLTYCQLLFSENPARAADAAEKLLGQTGAADHLMILGDLFLKTDRTEDAARAYRAAYKADYNLADTIVGKMNSHVESHPGPDRRPLLEYLIYLVPMRGFAADVYQVMEAEDLIAQGKTAEAKKCLEALLTTDAKWKGMAELTKLALTEGKREQELLAKRLELALTDAERAGQSIWSEIAYCAALLWESSGNPEPAMKRLELLIEREYRYRDAVERLDRLRLSHSADPGHGAPVGS